MGASILATGRVLGSVSRLENTVRPVSCLLYCVRVRNHVRKSFYMFNIHDLIILYVAELRRIPNDRN